MFLNRLEIVGFKSFAERIHVEFNNGITAVVGPNGSGKSNIIDAIRWVLGEQSARSLRGHKMEDIIFQGSDTRSQLNFAEVSLLLNNHQKQLPIDYEEVNITRRVYRSGESDFYINKQACRLKDIVDLFTDTGLGKESFSIIGQGKIDEILSSKAEERRAIFEEAAGVLKYKQRKIKAEYKLNETQENLLRVEDIIHEITTQLSPLKQQADRAKTYKEKRAALKEVEIALLVTEIEDLHTKWQEMLRSIEIAQEKEMAISTQIKQDEAKTTASQQRLQKVEEKLTSLQNRLVTLTEQVEQTEGNRNVILERLKHATENKSTIEKNEEDAVKRIEQFQQQSINEQREMEAIMSEKASISKKVESIDHMLTYGSDEIKEQIERLKSDYIDYLNEQAVIQNNGQTLQKNKEQLRIQKDNEEKNYQELHRANKSYEDEQKALLQAQSKLERVVTEAEQAVEDWKEEVDHERKTLDDMQTKLYRGNEQIATLQARKETLEEMKESFQGYYFSVKEVLKAVQAKQLQEIDGTVIDLIDVPDAYITAVDTVLGGQAQHIVCANDQAARAAISWLKKENKGRATFLPIASLSERRIPTSLLEKIQQVKGFVAVASDIIRTEKVYEKVVRHLIGNVIIAQDLQTANEIAGLTNRRFRVVTLEGDVVFPGGSMSGGTKKKANQSSLFTREKELVNLREKIANFKERAKEFAEEVALKRKQVDTLLEKEKSVEERLTSSKEALQENSEKLHEVGVNVRAKSDELSIYKAQMEQYEKEQTTLKTAIIDNDKQLASIQATIHETEQAINALTEQETTLQADKQTKAAEKHALEKTLVELEERLRNRQNRLQEINEQKRQAENERSEWQEQLAELKEIEEKTMDAASLKENLLTLKKEREEVEKSLENERNERYMIMKQLDDMQQELKAKEQQLLEQTKDIQTKEVQANRLDVTLENHLNHLQTEYVTTFERANQSYAKVDDVEKAKHTVQQLKQAIKLLGTVNLGAIEEYDRLEERYTFLEEQKTDLLEAKATLYAVIEEMDTEMVKRFSEMFADIQVAFTDVFKKLFGGGHAELILTDQHNLLETGIEIIASPPGKRQKALSLLSGGERALTAIALLFAILRVKPVPFCILDEVDASLDEANVARFANYLNQYSDGTQFIVITHRKGTMEEANVLYGVTMQESGVSRLVSVRLEDAEDLVDIS